MPEVPELAAALQRIERIVTITQEFMVGVRTTLGQINQACNEIASEQTDLIARLTRDGITDAERTEILTSLAATRERLNGIASGYTPVPVEPGSTPGSEPLPE